MLEQKSSLNFENYYNYFPIHLDFISDYNLNLNLISICMFNQAMIGYASLYELLIKNGSKALDFSTLKFFWSSYFSEIEKIKQENEKIKTKNEEIKKKIQNLKEINSDISHQCELIKDSEKNILKHEFYLVPFSFKYERVKYNSKTNICHNCKFNCHKDCDELLKTNCQCFDWSFRCKVCPNRCKSKYHEVVDYSFPKYEYKTIDQILESYHLKKKTSVGLKISSVLQKLNKDENENEEKIKNLEKNIKNICNCSITYDDILRKGMDKSKEKIDKLFFKGKEMKLYELLLIFIFQYLLEIKVDIDKNNNNKCIII